MHMCHGQTQLLYIRLRHYAQSTVCIDKKLSALIRFNANKSTSNVFQPTFIFHISTPIKPSSMIYLIHTSDWAIDVEGIISIEIMHTHMCVSNALFTEKNWVNAIEIIIISSFNELLKCCISRKIIENSFECPWILHFSSEIYPRSTCIDLIRIHWTIFNDFNYLDCV